MQIGPFYIHVKSERGRYYPNLSYNGVVVCSIAAQPTETAAYEAATRHLENVANIILAEIKKPMFRPRQQYVRAFRWRGEREDKFGVPVERGDWIVYDGPTPRVLSPEAFEENFTCT